MYPEFVSSSSPQRGGVCPLEQDVMGGKGTEQGVCRFRGLSVVFIQSGTGS